MRVGGWDGHSLGERGRERRAALQESARAPVAILAQLWRASSGMVGGTGWTGASPVSTGGKIMNLALVKAVRLMPLGGGGWVMRWAGPCVCIAGGIAELVFDLAASHALGWLKNLPGGREVSASGREFPFIRNNTAQALVSLFYGLCLLSPS